MESLQLLAGGPSHCHVKWLQDQLDQSVTTLNHRPACRSTLITRDST